MSSFFERDGGLALQRVCVGEILLADADGIDDDEAVFGFGVGRDLLKLRVGDDTDAAAFHLLEEVPAAHAAHEKDDFEGPNVGAGGDHVDGDHNPGIVAVSEGREQVFGLDPAVLVDDGAVVVDNAGRAGAVGDFLAEVVAAAEFVADDFDDVVGVAVVFGEDERLGNVAASGEDFRRELVAEGADNGADLIVGNDVTVELVGAIGEVLVELLPANPAALAVALVDEEAGFNERTML